MKELDLKLNVLPTSRVALDKEMNRHGFDGWIFVRPATDAKQSLPTILKTLPAVWEKRFYPIATKRKFESKAGVGLAIDGEDASRATLLCLDPEADMFQWLTHIRKVIDSAAFDAKVTHLAIDLTNMGDVSAPLSDAFMSAVAANLYKFPKYKGPVDKKTKSKESDESDALEVTFICEKTFAKAVHAAAQKALWTTTAGTNLVRWLGKRAGNDLTCKSYFSYLRSLAKERKWKFEHIDHDKLTALKAGAFLAVVQGSEHRDYGIAKLSYSPPGAKKHLVLVGKGLVFDTGGYNIKTSHMFGMHGDMAGSAVATAILNVATLEKWPVKITAFLAVADNMVGPKSYKPNDVVTSMNGTTIEIIDTDAEGRMVLSDTLSLASREEPDLMMDFATLTGSCVRAIGTTFSGVFTNRAALHAGLIEAGRLSGERVWPFPMDKDFAECLDSTSADTKQCREKGGVDHIEASQFLMKFVGKTIPWVHVDLSAAENPGGLAHIASDETGFGVRFAGQFARQHLKF